LLPDELLLLDGGPCCFPESAGAAKAATTTREKIIKVFIVREFKVE
jgi:hypothetical protein